MQVLGGVDKEPDAHNAYLGNMMGTSNSIAINRAISLAEFNAGEPLPAKSVQACMEVAKLHFEFSRGVFVSGQACDPGFLLLTEQCMKLLCRQPSS